MDVVHVLLCGQAAAGSPSKQPLPELAEALGLESRQKPQKTLFWLMQVPSLVPGPVQQAMGCPAAVHTAVAL